MRNITVHTIKTHWKSTVAGLALCWVAVAGPAQVATGAGSDGQGKPQEAAAKRNNFSSAIGRMASAAGDRFQKAGKERLYAVADLTLRGHAAVRFTLVMEFPNRLRLESGGAVTTFRPDRGRTKGESDDVADLADTLLYDSLDGLLAAQTAGGASRFEGRGYRNAKTGEMFEVFTAFIPTTKDGGETSAARQFWFDQRTHLLAKVVTAAGDQVVYAGWRQVNGNWFPTTITRFRGGDTVAQIALSEPAFDARKDDGLFQ